MIRTEKNIEAGKKALKKAKDDMASGKRCADHDMQQVLLGGVSHEVRQPITVMGDPIKAYEYRKKNKISCCICGISAGTFYVNNGEKFCSQHKAFMYMDKAERRSNQNVN